MPGIQVTEETDFKVLAQDAGQAVRGMAMAIETLESNSELRVQMGKAGRQLVDENYNWKFRGKQLDEMY